MDELELVAGEAPDPLLQLVEVEEHVAAAPAVDDDALLVGVGDEVLHHVDAVQGLVVVGHVQARLVDRRAGLGVEMLQSAYHLPEDLSLGLGVEVVDEDVLAVHQLHLERLEVVYPGCGDAVELADVLVPGPLTLGELDALLVDSPLDEPVPLYLDLVERPALAAFDPGDELLESVLLAVSDVERIQLYAGVGEPADELALLGDVLERLLVVEHEDSRDSALGAGLLH